MEDVLGTVRTFVTAYGLKVIGAILIFLVGRIVARAARRVVRGMMERGKAEPMLVSFVSQLTYALLMALIVVAALQTAGVPAASAVAVVGAAGLAVGLALQGSLANFAAGVLLIIFRPFKVGDFVQVGGETGTVEEIDVFTTRLTTPDNRLVIIPNNSVTGSNITNYSAKGTRRVDMVVGISYEDDVAKARSVIERVLNADERILKDPAPVIAVVELADSSVNLAVRPWTSAADYWGVYFDTLENVKKRLDEEGVTIPFPQRDVHLFQRQTA